MNDIVLASCDSKFFKQHSKAFANTCNMFNHNCHIHVVNPDEDDENKLKSLEQDNQYFTYSTENVKIDKSNRNAERAYYACTRFLIAPKLLDQNPNRRLLILDIDSIIRKPLKFPDKPLGLFIRETAPDWDKVAAGIVYVGYNGREYIDEVVNSINDEYKKHGFYWFIDQIALYNAYEKVKHKFDIYRYNQNDMDWEMSNSASIWTGRGSRKYNNSVYINERKKYE